MDEFLEAHTPNELRYYLMVASCASCGGALEAVGPEPPGEADAAGDLREAVVQTRCKRCRTQQALRFRWDHDVPDVGEDADCINPTGEASRIIDLRQWVSLYYLFADPGAKASSPADSRRIARRAYLCLAEALKFYGRDEFPPEPAFFSKASLASFREHPANYARQRLRDLQAKLPVPVHHDGQAPPAASGTKPWWRRLWQS